MLLCLNFPETMKHFGFMCYSHYFHHFKERLVVIVASLSMPYFIGSISLCAGVKILFLRGSRLVEVTYNHNLLSFFCSYCLVGQFFGNCLQQLLKASYSVPCSLNLLICPTVLYSGSYNILCLCIIYATSWSSRISGGKSNGKENEQMMK